MTDKVIDVWCRRLTITQDSDVQDIFPMEIVLPFEITLQCIFCSLYLIVLRYSRMRLAYTSSFLCRIILIPKVMVSISL